MKTITFFSEKGGVGKSSFSMMYASWLKYVHGVKVGIADFNMRIKSYRMNEYQLREKFIKKNPELGYQHFDLDSAWPIASIRAIDRENHKKISKYPNASWFKEEVESGSLNDLEVVICDFPGNLSGMEFVELLNMKYLNLIVIPTERETQTMQSTFKLNKVLEGKNRCIFINKAKLNLPNIRKKYIDMGKSLASEEKWPILPDMVAYSEKMGDMDRVDDIRSTFCYPDFSLPQFGKMQDLGIENLFIDVTRELAKTPDFKGTLPADLGFVENLQKKDDGRQFTGSAYPMYEI